MGAHTSVAESPLGGYVHDEFQRVLRDKKKGVLYLHQVLQLQPPQDCPLEFSHIATLWKLDNDHNGCVTFAELMTFAEFCNEKWRILGPLDFQAKLKAQCMVDMWDVVSDDTGEEAFVQWICLLVSQGDDYAVFDASPGVKFMSRDAVMTLFELMKPYKISAHVDQQGFLDTLQQIGEQMGLSDLMAEELDDWVPTEVVERWLKRFIQAYNTLFQELAWEPPRGQSSRPAT